MDAAWTQLAFLGVISSTNPSLKNASVAGDRGEVRGDGDWARAAGDLGFDTKEADVSGGLKRLASVSVCFASYGDQKWRGMLQMLLTLS